jgi:hypothetical protein
MAADERTVDVRSVSLEDGELSHAERAGEDELLHGDYHLYSQDGGLRARHPG